MRIEMKATGLMGMMNVAFYQMQFNSFSNLSDEVKENFERVSSSLYSLNGGIGTLQNAVTLIQQRITQENQKRDNIQSARNETNNFLKETVATDRRVENVVSQNNEQFYQVNSHLKPMPSTIIVLNVDIFKILQQSENIVQIIQKGYSNIEKCAKFIINTIDENGKKISEFLKKIGYKEHGVFDEDNKGYYGGDQGSPMQAKAKEKKEFYEIIRRNNPDTEYSDKQLKKYLKKINDEGCGYVALVNMILCYFQDKPDEFYEKFGYPLRDEKGQLNYNKLLVDLYSSMDNRRTDGTLDIMHDYNRTEDGSVSKYDYRNDSTGIGTSPYERAYYAEEFLRRHGVEVTAVPQVPVTVENYNQIVSEGKHVVISYHDGNIYDEKGKKHYIDGGHAMYVTGVTDDGKFIVSYWSEKYYIYPDDPNSNKEQYSFATFEY